MPTNADPVSTDAVLAKPTTVRRKRTAIGSRVRDLRQSRGWSQIDLETRSGLRRCYIARVELGITTPLTPNVVRLATAFGLSVSEFLTYHKCRPADEHPTDQEFLREITQSLPGLDEARRSEILQKVKELAEVKQ